MKENNNCYLIALTKPLPGKEAEYNQWYDNIHLKEVVAIDRVLSGKRFKLADTQMTETPHYYKYMVIYEIEAGHYEEALENIKAAMPNMNIEPVIDPTDQLSYLVEPI